MAQHNNSQLASMSARKNVSPRTAVSGSKQLRGRFTSSSKDDEIY
jgi:hypothetical protein